MDTLLSSLQRVAVASIIILAIVSSSYLIWRLLNFVGSPVGKMIVHQIPSTELQQLNDADFQECSSKVGAVLGVFMCVVMSAASRVQMNLYPRKGPTGLPLLVADYAVNVFLRPCIEAAAVLAVLSGIVKACGLDARKKKPVDAEKTKASME